LDGTKWEQYKKLPKGLLIIDTFRASQGKNENDSQDMAYIMSRLKELRDEGYTIVLLHHTPKANDRIYKGSTAIIDLSDHVLALHKVRKKGTSYEETTDDDDGRVYRLGTKDKTRYEPYHVYIDFDPEKGFVVAPDPDEEDLKRVGVIIFGLKKELKHLPNQTQVVNSAVRDLGIGKSRTQKLLRKGEGKYWQCIRKPERHNAKCYDLLENQFVGLLPLYSKQQTEKQPVDENQFDKEAGEINNRESAVNIEFDSLLDTISSKQTGKTQQTASSSQDNQLENKETESVPSKDIIEDEVDNSMENSQEA